MGYSPIFFLILLTVVVVVLAIIAGIIVLIWFAADGPARRRVAAAEARAKAGSIAALEPLRHGGGLLWGQSLDLGSWGAAVAVLLVTTAVGIGMRLRRDTEGLV